MGNVTLTIEDLDFDYENKPIRVTATASLSQIEVAGKFIGPLEEGKEYEMPYWLAAELSKRGYTRFSEELLTFATLNKIHWRETKLQTGLQVSALPEYFYPKLRRYLMAMREKTSTEASNEYTQAFRLAKDIVNCRLKKIVSIAASTTRPATLLQSLTEEEIILFEGVRAIVSEWENQILKKE
jgi:hypothetical protein